MKSRDRNVGTLICLSLLALLAACGGGSGASPTSSVASTPLAMQGAVHGGQQPVTGAQITAYAAGNGGFGSSAVALACTQTNSSGNFSFGGPAALSCSGSSLPTSFSCPSATCPSASAEIYLVASGGNPGLAAGTNNAALQLLSALGPYNQTSSSTFVNITELTTVAAVYSLAQMMGATSSGCVNCTLNLGNRLQAALDIGAKSPWLESAFARADSLVNISPSGPGTALPANGASACVGSFWTEQNCGALLTLNTLADSLAACVNTAGASSSACTQLFCVATPGATFSGSTCTPPSGGSVPQNTLQSALAIALNPGLVPASGVYSMAGAIPAFTPTLTTAPNNWTLSLNFSGAPITSGGYIAIDAAGNVWVAGDYYVTGMTRTLARLSKFNNTGTLLSPPSGFDYSSATSPDGGGTVGVAIDASGNVWVLSNYGTLSKFSSEGVLLSPTAGYTGGGLCIPGGLAIDSAGNIWVANSNDGTSSNANAFLPCSNIGAGRVSEFDSNGVALSPAGGYADGSPAGVHPGYFGIAIDSSGSVWTVDGINHVLRKFNSSGTALTPAGGYQGGGLSGLGYSAIDGLGNLWIADGGIFNGSVGANAASEFSNSGAPMSPLGGYTGGGMGYPQAVAIDGANNVWLASYGTLTELNNSGVPLSPSGFFANYAETALAIDGAGNVWSGGSELIGAAVPVRSPLIGPPQSP